MYKKIFLLLLFLQTGINAPLVSQQQNLTQRGTSMSNFLKIGVHARASALGNSYVALSDDVGALYWNPGGIGMLRENQAIVHSSDWFLGTSLYFLGVTFRLERIGVFGLHIYSFSSGDIEETTIYEPDGTGRLFNTGNMAVGISYGRQLTDRFSFGLTIKYIHEQLDRTSAATVAIDLGSVYVTNFFNNMRIGFALSNLGGRMKLSGSDLTIQYVHEPGTKYTTSQFSTEPWDIPLMFRFGIATDLLNWNGYRLTGIGEVMDPRDFIFRVSSGMELAFHELVFLRGGYIFNYEEIEYTLGIGLQPPEFQGLRVNFDYAYEQHYIFDGIQKISLVLRF
jgi:hypothetical protein